MKELEHHGETLSPEGYKIYRRNLIHLSLRGEKVKSKEEKYIADYLCEHNIPYQYERLEPARKDQQEKIGGSYRPDFTINFNNKRYRLERWGIDENDRHKSVPSDWSETWDDYKEQMGWKRSFWRERQEILIETSVVDLKRGREEFESIVEQRLTSIGVPCNRLTDREIFNKIITVHRTTITQLFVQFIQKSKNNFYHPQKY
jgi:DNA helicase-4